MGMVDYKVIELAMINFDSDSNSSSDNDSFFRFVLLGNKNLMDASDLEL